MNSVLISGSARGLRLLLIAAAVGAFAGPAFAQSSIPSAPAVKVLKGELKTVTEADAYYGSAVQSTNGLCAEFPTNGEICTSLRPPEIKELARALRGDPDLIYEYVRNSVDTEFQYGLQKGALGALIDKSGTPFDQAQLMVELLRESGATASYKVGTITLTGTQFQDWTGITNAKAACEFLAAGGIPGSINGSTSSTCTYSGTVTTITLGHAWVEAVIGGAAYVFDPSFKAYEAKAGIDVRAGMSFTAGQASTAAGGTTGMTGSTPSVVSLNDTALDSQLQTWSGNLLTRLRQPDMRAADLKDVIGGRVLAPGVRPSGGWRQTTLSYATPSKTWTGNVPDQYRTKFTVAASGFLASHTFYVDEIYGRRLQVATTRVANPNGTPGAQGWQPFIFKPTLVLDGVAVDVSATGAEADVLVVDLTLTANHPFAALSGTYADGSSVKKVFPLFPATIVHGWGTTSRQLAEKWQREQGVDRVLGITQFGGGVDPFAQHGPVPIPSGDLARARMGASWLAQFSAAMDVHGQLVGGEPTHLHTLGVVSSIMHFLRPVGDVPPPDSEFVAQTGFTIADETTAVDLETTFALTLNSGSVADRRAAILAIAATGAALEATVASEATDAPDTASTAQRFAWGNKPEAGETPSTASRPVYQFASGTTGVASGLVVFENLASGVQGQFGTQAPLDSSIVDVFKTRLWQTIENYTTAGFDVVASSEALLGPGHRNGTEYAYHIDYYSGIKPKAYFKRFATTQAGGALIATKYDASGDPIEVAHIVLRDGLPYKGGGGSSVTQLALYDPKLPGDIIKDRFVDRSTALGVDLSTGVAGFVSPTVASIGPGEAAPYRLDARFELRGGAVPTYGVDGNPNPWVDLDGVVSNWEGSAEISNSTLEGMGASRMDAAIPMLVSFVAMQDIWKQSASPSREVKGVLVAAWWGRQLNSNIISIKQGGSTQQFVRLVDGSWVPTDGGPARLDVTGSRHVVRPALIFENRPEINSTQREEVSRVWRNDTLQISAIGANGDVRHYDYWEWWNGGMNTEAKWTGFRLKDWVYPNGVKLTLGYAERVGVPTSVTNSLGYTLQIPQLGESPCFVINGDNAFGTPSVQGTVPVFQQADAMGGVTKVEYRGVVFRSVTQRPDERCPVLRVYTPSDQAIASLEYAYDTTGKVKEARDGVAIRTPASRQPYQFFIADGYRGERQDPETGRYAVETLRGGRTVRTVDELGRVVVADRDGRGRVTTRTYPEGDYETFSYDIRGNMTSLTRYPKPGSGLSPLTTTVTYVEDASTAICANQKVCNRPLSGDGPRTDVTDVTNYTWDSATGNLTQVLKPADSAGVRPQTDYGYTTYTLSSVSMSLLTTMTEKIDASTSTTTTLQYDAANKLLLNWIEVDSGGLNLKTCYQYDVSGNIVGASDPRTSSCPSIIQ